MLVIRTSFPLDFINSELLNSCIHLVEANKELIKKNEPKNKSKVKKSLEERVCESFISKGITPEFVEKLIEVYPMCAVDFILREAAIVLDSNYKENHIKDCKEVWTINYVSKNPEKTFNFEKSYKITPLFRTKEDAYKARSLVIDLLDKL